MLDRQQQDAISAAVEYACDVFRGGLSDPSHCVGFALAMLLLKFISDTGHDYVDSGDKPPDDTHFIVPKGSNFYTLQADKLQSGNGQRIDNALQMIEKVNPILQGAFQGISFDAPMLGSIEQKDRVLCQLLDAFKANAFDFRADNESAAEAVAYACDSLLKYVAENSSNRDGVFTPSEISQLIARLVQPEDGDAICDPCCGSGSLLITCSQLVRQRTGHQGCTLYGQEKNGSTFALAKMNMVLHDEARAQLEWGDTLRNPKLLVADGSLMKFEIVVSNPPFSIPDWGHQDAERDIYQRYRRGAPPRASADYAFLSHMIESLKPKTGRMAVVVPLGVLFRGAAERQIRERLLQENLIDAVIALPAKMLSNTGIPVAILVVRQNKTDDNVLFIDASHSYLHGKTQNTLHQTDLDLIESTYRARDDIKRFARLVTQADIAANEYNLSVARYIYTAEDEVEVDLTALRAKRTQLKAELTRLEARLAALLAETGLA